jgi:hypothetical protein
MPTSNVSWCPTAASALLYTFALKPPPRGQRRLMRLGLWCPTLHQQHSGSLTGWLGILSMHLVCTIATQGLSQCGLALPSTPPLGTCGCMGSGNMALLNSKRCCSWQCVHTCRETGCVVLLRMHLRLLQATRSGNQHQLSTSTATTHLVTVAVVLQARDTTALLAEHAAPRSSALQLGQASCHAYTASAQQGEEQPFPAPCSDMFGRLKHGACELSVSGTWAPPTP